MIAKIIAIIILAFLIVLWFAVDRATDYYSQCYTAEEDSGHAVFGNCSGKKSEEHCKKCRYYYDINNQE